MQLETTADIGDHAAHLYHVRLAAAKRLHSRGQPLGPEGGLIQKCPGPPGARNS